MSMTKADFQAIADAVAEATRSASWLNEVENRDDLIALVLSDVVKELATACARQYKGGYGFNRQRFVAACGFPEA